MSEFLARSDLKSLTIDAVIIRCGCGNPTSHIDRQCPIGIREDVGTISYWHKNIFKRMAWKLRRFFNG